MKGRIRMAIVLDTNILMNNPEDLLKNIDEQLIVPSIVVEELDHLKTNSDSKKAFEARQGMRYLRDNEGKYKFVLNDIIKSEKLINGEFDLNKNDNKILDVCMREKAKIFSLDLNVILKAKALEIETIEREENKDNEFQGYKEVSLSDTEMADFYSNLHINKWNLLINEYILIKNADGEIVDKYKWNGNEFEIIRYTAVQHKLIEKIKPRNLKQELAFDMLQDKNIKIKILQGLHGSGKTLLLVAHALNLIEKGKFDKIIWVVQNQQVKDTGDIGALPGGLEEKMMPWTNILADKIGGQYGLDMLITERKLEIIPLAFIRGRSFSRSIVTMSESENATSAHMKLLISRLEEDSILMLDGDFKQTDKAIFKADSGLKSVINCLKGQPEFGLMTLNDVERSKLANLASLLD